MKSNSLLKSGLGLLLVAGTLTPLASFGGTTPFSYGEGDVYDNLRRIQQAPSSMTAVEPGAQGPRRTDSLEEPMSYDEGAVFDNLRKIQASKSIAPAEPHGAQGPTRTEGFESDFSYHEGAMYDNLRKIQSMQ
jgi:hypothetical protein